jgi:hypothetical protein
MAFKRLTRSQRKRENSKPYEMQVEHREELYKKAERLVQLNTAFTMFDALEFIHSTRDRLKQ